MAYSAPSPPSSIGTDETNKYPHHSQGAIEKRTTDEDHPAHPARGDHRRGGGALRPHPAHRPTLRRSPRTGHYRPAPPRQPSRARRPARRVALRLAPGRRPRRANVVCPPAPASSSFCGPRIASCAACPPGAPLQVRSVQRHSPLPARSPPTRTTNDKYPLHPPCGCNGYRTTAPQFDRLRSRAPHRHRHTADDSPYPHNRFCG